MNSSVGAVGCVRFQLITVIVWRERIRFGDLLYTSTLTFFRLIPLCTFTLLLVLPVATTLLQDTQLWVQPVSLGFVGVLVFTSVRGFLVSFLKERKGGCG